MTAHDHPAFLAWRSLTRGRSCPEDVQPVVRSWRKPKKKKPKPIFRLTGLEDLEHPVIAKCCRPEVAARELAVYTEILPQAPVQAPRLLGSVSASDGSCTWLFLEDVMGADYSPSLENHRELAGKCLGLLHYGTTAATRASRLARLGYLYDTGPEGIYSFLRSTLDLLPEVKSNPMLAPADRDTLTQIASQCRALKADWPELDNFCRTGARTLVHGDLLIPNLRVRSNGSGPAVVVFDWERAGWGVPAIDLTRFLGSDLDPDLGAYLDIARHFDSTLDTKTVRRLAYVGEVFRWLEAVRWEVENLRWEWVEKPMHRLRTYELWMNDIARAAPWRDNPALAEGDWRSFLPANC